MAIESETPNGICRCGMVKMTRRDPQTGGNIKFCPRHDVIREEPSGKINTVKDLGLKDYELRKNSKGFDELVPKDLPDETEAETMAIAPNVGKEIPRQEPITLPISFVYESLKNGIVEVEVVLSPKQAKAVYDYIGNMAPPTSMREARILINYQDQLEAIIKLGGTNV